jgi:hypothetical protein
LNSLKYTRLALKSESLSNHLDFCNKGCLLKYTSLLVIGFLMVKWIRVVLVRRSILLRGPLKRGVFLLFHDRQDLLSIVEKNSYFSDVSFLVRGAREARLCSESTRDCQFNAPSFSIVRKYIKLYYKKMLLNKLLSIRGAKYVAEVVMQASIMEANNLIDVPKIYSFGYLHAGGVLLTEYTASIERTLYSVQHGYLFENPVLNNLAAVGLIEDGADTILAWTSSCITKYKIAFSEMESRTPDIESLELDQVIEKNHSYKSGRVIMLMTPMTDFSHVAEANRFIDICLMVGMKPVVTLHPSERNFKSLLRYARRLKANVRYVTFRDSRLFFNEQYILSNGSSLLFFAFLNGAKVGYWVGDGEQVIESIYHFVGDHISNKAKLENFLMEI